MAYSLSTVSNNFKIKYGKVSENIYNSANVLLGRAIKKYDFVGSQKFENVPLSFQGGVGSGTIPVYNNADYGGAILTAKRVYAVAEIEREAIYAAQNNEGAFYLTTKEPVQKAVESYMRNCSRILFNDGTGSLGSGDNATNVTGAGTTGSPYTFVISAATWKEANWEENDYVNIGSETTNLEVVTVDPSTRTISVVGTSATLAALTGSGPLNSIVYMQGSKDNDPYGLKYALDATSGSVYNITVSRRWKALQAPAGGSGVTTDMMNADMLAVQKKCGKVPNLIITSFTQFRKILNLLEDQKQYNLDPRAKDLVGKVSFKGVEFMSSSGPVGIFPERFCEDDRIYYLNDNYIQIHHRPGFGWFDDDGTVFLRKASSDAYEARYGGYWQTYIPPAFHGVRTGLAT